MAIGWTIKLTATNPGNIIWLKASYNFVAQAVSADLEFIDISPSYGIGVLIDDITIYECPNDVENPACSIHLKIYKLNAMHRFHQFQN